VRSSLSTRGRRSMRWFFVSTPGTTDQHPRSVPSLSF
jgi:hypothetical protein